MSEDQWEDDPAQGFLGLTRVILHIVSESGEEGGDKQDTALIQKFERVLLRVFERPPEAQVDELDHTGKVEKEDLDHGASVYEEHWNHEDQASDHIEGRKKKPHWGVFPHVFIDWPKFLP